MHLNSATLLEANQLSCRRLWTNLSFVLPAGGLLQISGDNGSGKTSLIKILCGLMPPHNGQVLWQQQNIAANGEEYCADLIYIGHKNGIKDDLTPLENLQFAAALHTGKPLHSPKKALSTVGIDARRQLCRHLSAGQKRRTALARLLLNRARLWFLDEPLSALDVAGQQILAQLLGAHLSGGGGAILATHQPVGVAATQTLRLCAP